MNSSTRSWLGRASVAITVVLLAGLWSFPAPAGAAVYTVPTSIDRAGVSDVTVALNNFFASVPNGSTITFPAGSRYRIEGTLYLKNRSNLVFEGNGATFFATTVGTGTAPYPAYNAGIYWPRNRDHWLFDTSTNITVRNIIVKGANPKAGPTNEAFVVSLEAQHGIEFARSSGVIENTTVTDTYGDLVSITKGSTGVTVRNNRLERSGRQGVTVDQADGVTITNNYVGMIGRSTFDLEPATNKWVVRNVLISNNTVGRANGVAVASYGKGPVDNITVSGNRLVGEPLVVLVESGDGGRRKNWKVLNNTSDSTFGSPVAPLRFTRVDGVEIRDNYQRIVSTQSRLAVRTTESCAVVLSGNNFPLWNGSTQTATGTQANVRMGATVCGTTAAPPPSTTTTAPQMTH